LLVHTTKVGSHHVSVPLHVIYSYFHHYGRLILLNNISIGYDSEIDVPVNGDDDPVLHLAPIPSAFFDPSLHSSPISSLLKKKGDSKRNESSTTTDATKKDSNTINGGNTSNNANAISDIYPSRVAASFASFHRLITFHRPNETYDERRQHSGSWLLIFTKWDIFEEKMKRNGIGAFVKTFPDFPIFVMTDPYVFTQIERDHLAIDGPCVRYARHADTKILDAMWYLTQQIAPHRI
jgi:hypothetical protein